ncbi:MAG: hypothetical protein ACT4P2_11040 [Pseudomonadota bacterium]
MPVQDEAKKKFGDFIKLQTIDGKFITREEEKQILQEGVMRFDIPLEDGRGIMLGVAAENGYILQRDCDRSIEQILERFASRKGYINEKGFGDAVAIYKKKSMDCLPEPEVRKQVKKLMQAKGWKPRRSGWVFRSKKWYAKI